MLLPIYDEMEDGSEILWEKDKVMSVARMKTLVKSKRQLPVFDDREEKDNLVTEACTGPGDEHQFTFRTSRARASEAGR